MIPEVNNHHFLKKSLFKEIGLEQFSSKPCMFSRLVLTIKRLKVALFVVLQRALKSSTETQHMKKDCSIQCYP